jgi:hypothetical protein
MEIAETLSEVLWLSPRQLRVSCNMAILVGFDCYNKILQICAWTTDIYFLIAPEPASLSSRWFTVRLWWRHFSCFISIYLSIYHLSPVYLYVMFAVLEIEFRASHMLGKCSTTWAMTPAFVYISFLRQGLANFAQASLKFVILLSLPPGWVVLHAFTIMPSYCSCLLHYSLLTVSS